MIFFDVVGNSKRINKKKSNFNIWIHGHIGKNKKIISTTHNSVRINVLPTFSISTIDLTFRIYSHATKTNDKDVHTSIKLVHRIILDGILNGCVDSFLSRARTYVLVSTYTCVCINQILWSFWFFFVLWEIVEFSYNSENRSWNFLSNGIKISQWRENGWKNFVHRTTDMSNGTLKSWFSAQLKISKFYKIAKKTFAYEVLS